MLFLDLANVGILQPKAKTNGHVKLTPLRSACYWEGKSYRDCEGNVNIRLRLEVRESVAVSPTLVSYTFRPH